MGTKLEFKHFIVDRKGDIFASARDGSDKVHNFIISNESVLTQVKQDFCEISGVWADYIRDRVKESCWILPTFRVHKFNFNLN